MTKNELTTRLAEETGLAKNAAEKFLNAFTDVIADAMKNGDKVQLTGFGTFEAKTRAARTGINPATGAKVEIAECRVPSFKPGKGLKDKVNE